MPRWFLSLLIVAALAGGRAYAQQTYDVAVYGGTASGVIAATAASRDGAAVCIVEPGKHLGGMVSGGLSYTDVGNAATVGGITREFFERVGREYGRKTPAWQHEPHVADKVFADLIHEANVKVFFGQRLREKDGVRKTGGRITSFITESGQVFTAQVFIDASYEGDLMAQAGVKYVVGRESREQYGEERAGVRPLIKFGQPGIAKDQLGLLPDINGGDWGVEGQADKKSMAYTFRLCMTKDPAKRVAVPKPEVYDPRRYVLLLEELKKKPEGFLGFINPSEVPNGKYDVNNHAGVLVSTNLHNGSWGYPDGTYAERQRIWKDHENYVKGFYHFACTDPRLPEEFRAEARQWGLAKDEFTDNGNWPHQLYVRVGRRMLGEYVTTAADLTTNITKPDPAAMGSYFLDSHRVQRVALPDGEVATEGGVGGRTTPYHIAYRSLTPKQAECKNLLVPVCMSSSGVAWCSIRMEPVFMMMGHSAGVAAAMAAAGEKPVQQIDAAAFHAKLVAQKQVFAIQLPPQKQAQPSEPLAGIVVDNAQAAQTGEWRKGSAGSSFIGDDYLHDGNAEKGAKSVTFAARLPSDGEYEVRLLYPPNDNRASAVPVTVRSAQGNQTFKMDQRSLPEGQRSRLVTKAKFTSAQPAEVVISNEGTDGYVVADAVQFVPVQAPATTQAASLPGMRRAPSEAGQIEKFYPCVDKYGQYVHRDWPGKVKSDQELAASREAEATDLEAYPGPKGWNRFGGWADGPKLEATGAFRTTKRKGRWWLVDPEGRLFFSLGANCVRRLEPTVVEERKDWFVELPPEDGPTAAFWSSARCISPGPWQWRQMRSFAFNGLNWLRKYGPEWPAITSDLAHRRLRSWGLNTIANWSDEPVYSAKRTPYMANLFYQSRSLEGCPQGFPDPFDPSFRHGLGERMKKEAGKSAGDAMCIGYFVNNELPWGREHSLGQYTLQSPADQPAKAAMLDDLKTKYQTIAALNAAWQSSYGSWEALGESRQAPTNTEAIKDQEAFHARFAETYFKAVREVLKEHAPKQLYLGCRFNTRNRAALAAAAKCCDVVSFNIYEPTVQRWSKGQPDVPEMVTEFSIGATDRGMFYAGLLPSKNQAARAQGLVKFLESVLANPRFVGCHWFQYQDQPCSGRTLDGENGQFGLVDITDNPYPETIEALRGLSERMYAAASGAAPQASIDGGLNETP